MNKYRNTEEDIHQRIYKFILGCFKDIVKKIPKTTENLPIIHQVSSSLTSMGANDQEADASGSRRDFIAKYQVVDPYIAECQEILLIVSKIIENAKHPKI